MSTNSCSRTDGPPCTHLLQNSSAVWALNADDAEPLRDILDCDILASIWNFVQHVPDDVSGGGRPHGEIKAALGPERKIGITKQQQQGLCHPKSSKQTI